MKSDTFVYRSRMPASATEVFAWHTRQGAFSRFAPPWERMRLIADGHPIREGSRAEIDVSIGPRWRRWTAEHRDFVPGRRFRDVQIRGPFARWGQCHLPRICAEVLMPSMGYDFRNFCQNRRKQP